MNTNCRDCGCPIQIHSDTSAQAQCEACETVLCKCGSTDFKLQRGLYCQKVVCVECNNLIEAIFDKTPTTQPEETPVGITPDDEAQLDEMIDRHIQGIEMENEKLEQDAELIREGFKGRK